MSQWGEIEDCNLVRDQDTGKSKCFAFIKYCDHVSVSSIYVYNLFVILLIISCLAHSHITLRLGIQRSTILAVDNFTGAQLLGRTLRVDHVQKYRLPKDLRDKVTD